MVMIRYVQETDKGWNIKKKLLGGGVVWGIFKFHECLFVQISHA